MLGSALYYPHIDIQDPVWLRSAILYWDDIQTIVPSAIENPYVSADTRVCFNEGYLKPLRCDLHNEVIDDLGSQIIGSLDWRRRRLWHNSVSGNDTFKDLDRPEKYSSEIEFALRDADIHPDKLSPELRGVALRIGLARLHNGKISPRANRFLRELGRVRIHPEKMSFILRDLLEEEGFQDGEANDWLMVDAEFAAAYMSALATRLSKQINLSPLTSYPDAQASTFRFMFDDLVDDSQNSATGAMLAVIMRGLRIDPSIGVERLIQFRRNHTDQYADFAGQILELKTQIENAG
ncbi:MAG: hypothetical protein R3B94_08870 [Hyphomonas sp.]